MFNRIQDNKATIVFPISQIFSLFFLSFPFFFLDINYVHFSTKVEKKKRRRKGRKENEKETAQQGGKEGKERKKD